METQGYFNFLFFFPSEITSCESICIMLGTLLLFWIVLLEQHLHTVLEKPQIVSDMAQYTKKKQKTAINQQIIYS